MNWFKKKVMSRNRQCAQIRLNESYFNLYYLLLESFHQQKFTENLLYVMHDAGHKLLYVD